MNNQTAEELKQLVREKYSQIAEQSKEENAASCCGVGCGCSTVDYAVFADDYSTLEGYTPDADLGLGCGVPTEFAQIKEGDTVVDLGSGAGNDVFVARTLTGERGRVIGVDMTPKMIEKARGNNEKLGFNNVEFRLGEIENIPVSSSRVDVVISNCVLNLVPDKKKAFAEIARILKPGGHFSISDVVLEGELPAGLVHDAEMYAGCVAGAIQLADYMQLITLAGFEKATIQKAKKIILPDEILSQHLSDAEIEEFKKGNTGIKSITVFGKKPETANICCGSDCCAN